RSARSFSRREAACSSRTASRFCCRRTSSIVIFAGSAPAASQSASIGGRIATRGRRPESEVPTCDLDGRSSPRSHGEHGGARRANQGVGLPPCAPCPPCLRGELRAVPCLT